MTDGDAPPTDASDPARSGRAHGAGEPRPRTVIEAICAQDFEKLRRWALAHPDPYIVRPEPADRAPEPEPEPAKPRPRARATPNAPADHPGALLRWLPARLARLYRGLAQGPSHTPAAPACAPHPSPSPRSPSACASACSGSRPSRTPFANAGPSPSGCSASHPAIAAWNRGATTRSPATPQPATAAPTAPTPATSIAAPATATGRPNAACTGWRRARRSACSPSAAPGRTPAAASVPRGHPAHRQARRSGPRSAGQAAAHDAPPIPAAGSSSSGARPRPRSCATTRASCNTCFSAAAPA